MSLKLPLTVEELTPEWLGAALGVPVASVSTESIIWGTATKVFLEVDYETASDVAPPDRLCVKGGFNPDLRPLAYSGYLAETWFYEMLAPSLNIVLPRCWYAKADRDAQQGIVILDDLRAHGTVFPDMTGPLHPDMVAEALTQQAHWHSATWNSAGLEKMAWLQLGSPVQRTIIEEMLTPNHWDHHMNLPRGEMLPSSLKDPKRIMAGFGALWAEDDDSVTALAHGDAHMGNLFIDANGSPAFLDWQGVCRAPWSDDVSYLIGGALTPEDRRGHERDLLRHYLDVLAAEGAPSPTFDEAWLSYRKHHLHGLAWLLTTVDMQPERVSCAMGSRYAAACADHDVFALLGVTSRE